MAGSSVTDVADALQMRVGSVSSQLAGVRRKHPRLPEVLVELVGPDQAAEVLRLIPERSQAGKANARQ
ncbi:hypothetical protein [Conexibacter sp. SYSU D00693]|uniref:hypothetical protein n=1 Tax=Conexibacter sp. SYSU D00693 TaxID=2812560 RepID=UPI00196A4CD4|nr:hypothetical protein [Conexibacter sp. SYSU D00693]